MSWELLPTNFTDAVWSGLKRYILVDNEDGTVSFQDVTVYSNKEKSFFGAKTANRMNDALNVIMAMLENGTDLYELFQDYFEEQKTLFTGKSDDEFADFLAYIADLKEQGDERIESIETEYGTEIEEFKNRQEELFTVWFQGVREKLAGDVAAKLSSDVEDLKTNKQDKIKGKGGQIVGIDEDGNPVAVTRKINNQSLSNDIVLTAKDVGARPSIWIPTLNDIFSKNAGAHNSIFRGKNLGTSVTDAQYAAITAGTFDDLFIGDYWTIGGVNYRVAGFDYYYNTGTPVCTKHHAVIVPDTNLYNAKMNATNITEGGYVGSEMRRTNLEQAKTTIKAAFPNHVISNRIYLVNAVTDGKPTGRVWVDSEVDLMSEIMVYGSRIIGSSYSDGITPAGDRPVEKSQLPLFQHDPSRITVGNHYYWLRDVATAAAFAYVNLGNANCYNASASNGVRPAFCIS